MQASAWTLGSSVAGQLIRFGSNLVLTRLLFPEAFGLMALATVFLQGLEMFSDLGIRLNIIQSRQGDDRSFLDTAWTLQVLRGFALWICCCILAWPVAQFYDQPLLSLLVPVLGFSVVISGFTSTKTSTHARHLTIGRWTVADLSSALLGVVVMILWAWWEPTLWSLVAGNLVAKLARCVFSHWILPGPGNRFMWNSEALKELIRFGSWVFVSSVLSFLAFQADRLMFAKMIPIALLGVYNIGAMIARIPVDATNQLIMGVALPAYSRTRNQGGDLNAVFRQGHLRILGLTSLGLALLITIGPRAIELLYDERYHSAGWMVQIVAVGTWLMILQRSNAAALLALGQPKWIAISNVIKLSCIAAIVPFSFYRYGFPGALVAMTLVEIPSFLLLAFRTRKQNLRGWSTELITSGGVAICALAAAGMGIGIEKLGVGIEKEFDPWTKTAVGMGFYLATWIPLGYWILRSIKRLKTTLPPPPPDRKESAKE